MKDPMAFQAGRAAALWRWLHHVHLSPTRPPLIRADLKLWIHWIGVPIGQIKFVPVAHDGGR